jgi:hypothetical protein
MSYSRIPIGDHVDRSHGIRQGDYVSYENRQSVRHHWSHPAIVVGGNHERVSILLVHGPLAGERKRVSGASLILRYRPDPAEQPDYAAHAPEPYRAEPRPFRR